MLPAATLSLPPFETGDRRLSRTTLAELNAALVDLYSVVPAAQLPHLFNQILQRLLPGESHGCVIHDRATRQRRWAIAPAAAEQERRLPVFFAHFHEFAPAVYRKTRQTGEALALSDFVPAPRMETLTIYREYYRPIGMADDLSINVQHGTQVVCLAALRQRRGFRGPERALLDALRPHVKRAMENASARTAIERLPGVWSPEPLERELGITAREAEVLLWVAQGKTNPEVATILGIRPYTVRTHLERVFAKLGVETRQAAGVRAIEVLGLPPSGASIAAVA